MVITILKGYMVCQIISVNDNSTDKTKELLDAYHEKYAFIRPLHRDCEERGSRPG